MDGERGDADEGGMWRRLMPQKVAVERGWMVAGRPPMWWIDDCESVVAPYGVSSEYLAGALMAARSSGLRRALMKGRGVKPPEWVGWVL